MNKGEYENMNMQNESICLTATSFLILSYYRYKCISYNWEEEDHWTFPARHSMKTVEDLSQTLNNLKTKC